MKSPVFLLHITPRHLSDRLFTSHIGGLLRRVKSSHPMLFTHGLDRESDRQLAIANAIEDGIAGNPAAVDHLTRECSKKLVGGLTEEGVAAVSFQGSDMRLFRRNIDGKLECRIPTALEGVLRPGVVPVVSLVCASDNGRILGVEPGAALPILVVALAQTRDVKLLVLADGGDESAGALANTVRRTIGSRIKTRTTETEVVICPLQMLPRYLDGTVYEN